MVSQNETLLAALSTSVTGTSAGAMIPTPNLINSSEQAPPLCSGDPILSSGGAVYLTEPPFTFGVPASGVLHCWSSFNWCCTCSEPSPSWRLSTGRQVPSSRQVVRRYKTSSARMLSLPSHNNLHPLRVYDVGLLRVPRICILATGNIRTRGSCFPSCACGSEYHHSEQRRYRGLPAVHALRGGRLLPSICHPSLELRYELRGEPFVHPHRRWRGRR